MGTQVKEKPRISITVQIALIQLGALLLAMIVAVLVNGRLIIKNTIQESSDMAMTALLGASELVEDMIEEDGCDIKDMQGQWEDLHKRFRELCKRSGLRYMYLYTFEDEKTTRYIVASALSDEDDEMLQKNFSYGTETSRKMYDCEKKVLAGKGDSDFQIVNNQYGFVCMWVTGVRDGSGNVVALIGADYDVNFIISVLKYNYLTIVIMGAIVAIITFFISVTLIRVHIARPIILLSGKMNHFIEGKENRIVIPKSSFRDEISDIEDSFNKMETDIHQYVYDIENLTADRVSVQTQLDIARRIQSGIVPEGRTFSGKGYDIEGYSRPAKEVGGDFYDFFGLDENRVMFAIGDISGKGVSAALFMMMVRSCLREKIRSGETLSGAVNAVNDEIYASNPECMFATVFVGILDTQSGVVRYVNAGHNPPVLFGSDVREISVDPGIAIGIFECADMAEYEIRLKDGEGLFIYTDGITEAIDAADEQFREKRLMDALLRFVKGGGDGEHGAAGGAIREVIKDLDSFVGEAEQFDDITGVAVIYHREKKAGALELYPDMNEFGRIKEKVYELNSDEERAKTMIMCLEEAFSNIVSYSEAKHILFDCGEDAGKVSFTLSDDGVAFDPVFYNREIPEFNNLDKGGMGIALMRKYSDSIGYKREDGMNILTVTFNR
ncbi:MAG: SpoIIE family protein phosphatase [Butyrivibrio sp.]|nr:SpoIIE family protein phosphatase [Butyrivibrio sp.]